MIIFKIKGYMVKKIGSSKKQEIDGVPTIVYGWVNKADRKVFYSSLGFHCKSLDGMTSTRIESKLKYQVNRMLLDEFRDIKFVIVDVDLPLNFNKVKKGFLGIEVMVHSWKDISNERIEEFNGKVVELVKDFNSIEIYKTKKFL